MYAFSCDPGIVPFVFYYAFTMDGSQVVLVDEGAVSSADCVGFFVSFYPLMSWNSDDGDFGIRLVVI